MSDKENDIKTYQEIIDHYSRLDPEGERLAQDIGLSEWIRTIDIFERYLPTAPASLVDVGGATGVYACWLLERGYDVHLVDPVPQHVEQARETMARVAGSRRWSARIGDGRDLEFEADSADSILLLGPLYHLQRKEDRLQVLREAGRVLRPGGTVVCAAISRFASLIDGLNRGYIHDSQFREIVMRDLKSGCHHNLTGKPEYFTTAYFQHPAELNEEIEAAGFVEIQMLAVEGILWATQDLDALRKDEQAWRAVLDHMRTIEEDPSIIGASPHLLGIARKRAG